MSSGDVLGELQEEALCGVEEDQAAYRVRVTALLGNVWRRALAKYERTLVDLFTEELPDRQPPQLPAESESVEDDVLHAVEEEYHRACDLFESWAVVHRAAEKALQGTLAFATGFTVQGGTLAVLLQHAEAFRRQALLLYEDIMHSDMAAPPAEYCDAPVLTHDEHLARRRLRAAFTAGMRDGSCASETVDAFLTGDSLSARCPPLPEHSVRMEKDTAVPLLKAAITESIRHYHASREGHRAQVLTDLSAGGRRGAPIPAQRHVAPSRQGPTQHLSQLLGERQ
eukprot:Sspe_Gene.84179::Locus_55252_Transcript_1_1_Confidence_1.000_Length_902::g.84179::m.84179